jgi:peptide/nickel transport system permease protein
VIAAVLTEVTLSYIGVSSLSDWNWGTILYYAQSAGSFSQGAWWWFAPAGLCVAFLGMSLALIDFGIDEFVNPRLRNTGMNAGALKKRGIRPRIGFTPVVHEDAHENANGSTTGNSRAASATGVTSGTSVAGAASVESGVKQ